MDGTLQALPVEDAVAYTAANPLADGTYEVDLEAQEAREDAVIRNLAKGPAVAALVLATPTISVTTCVGWLPGANWLRFGFGVTRSRPRAAL